MDHGEAVPQGRSGEIGYVVMANPVAVLLSAMTSLMGPCPCHAHVARSC